MRIEKACKAFVQPRLTKLMNRFSADTLFLDHCSGGHTARQRQGFRTIIAAPINGKSLCSSEVGFLSGVHVRQDGNLISCWTLR